MADKAASVLAKLRNKAKASGISYQQCLQLFVQEEFLRKLSKSGYGDTLILKGGLFIYTLTNFESRATIDVDFLLRGYPNSIEDIKDFGYNLKIVTEDHFRKEILKILQDEKQKTILIIFCKSSCKKCGCLDENQKETIITCFKSLKRMKSAKKPLEQQP